MYLLEYQIFINWSCLYLKQHFQSRNLRRSYTDFKKFSKEAFNQELSLKLTNECVNNYSSFENIFFDTLNQHAPVKQKLLRANHGRYVT